MNSFGKVARGPQDGERESPGHTELLWVQGYERLRTIARQFLRGENPNHTLVPTALVHEAFVKLAKQGTSKARDRRQFFARAAQAMRHILVDHARRKRSLKRGGGRERIDFDQALDCSAQFDHHLLTLNEALTDLEAIDVQLARIVELRFFGGLTIDETAEVLEVAPVTIDRGWKTARSWLHLRLRDGG